MAYDNSLRSLCITTYMAIEREIIHLQCTNELSNKLIAAINVIILDFELIKIPNTLINNK